jgi:hypothetical protein
MKTIIQIVAFMVALGAVAFWATKGANRGWTKTQVQVKTVDEVTGLDAIKWKDEFLPGVDFLGVALLGAGILAGVSVLIRNKPKTKNETYPT